ncbi:hypothetical protein DAPPUDRAFT_310298 [Daphnia pulex]|uniref:Guanylate cyclase soluble subunit beta-1 n=1 Tax=Daphnia pulex TaxID=6669 RepID=E9FT54_DAPPU|nr:hypothetical protein DAPPUDRAFT_310298 [Daphnia pulex]|eukprot:EFX89313.1 hypothetical protein DAPPUDRAFT_310298 [Daphnia pulex]
MSYRDFCTSNQPEMLAPVTKDLAYGFVNYALELLVLENYGKDVWEQIKKEAEVNMEGHFLVRQIYEDEVTYNIVGAAERVLKVPANLLLEKFGEKFLDFCQDSGYDRILQVLGATPRDFLQNLDALHDHLATIYPGMKAPSFRCTDAPDGSLILHYYSDRPGLESIVIGIVNAVAKKLHKVDVDVKLLRSSQDSSGHGEFLIQEKNKGGAIASFDHDLFLILVSDPKISSQLFCRAFPFHVLFDRNLSIKQVGDSLKRILPASINRSGCKLTDILRMVRPHMELSFENLLAHINTVYILVTKEKKSDQSPDKAVPSLATWRHHEDGTEIIQEANLRLKGEMIYVQENGLMLFLGSPSVLNLEDLTRRGLYLSDIPLHDATRDLVLLSEQFEAEYKLTRDLEMLTDQLQQTKVELEREKQKTDTLLYSVLPPSVANELRHGRPVAARRYEMVTLLFSGIVGFSDLCARNSDASGVMKVVRMLNVLYTTFDVLTDPRKNPNIYKVETVGDKYMAVSGLPEPCQEQALCIARLALDMMDLSMDVSVDGISVQITIGIHCGEVMTGVIGQRMPRYCLFGNTVNLTSRTETTGTPGRINVSHDAYQLLQEPANRDPQFHFAYRGPVVMKGKAEPMKVYYLNRASDSKAVSSTTLD